MLYDDDDEEIFSLDSYAQSQIVQQTENIIENDFEFNSQFSIDSMAIRYFAGFCLKKFQNCMNCISDLSHSNEYTVATPSQYLILQKFHDIQDDFRSLSSPSQDY